MYSRFYNPFGLPEPQAVLHTYQISPFSILVPTQFQTLSSLERAEGTGIPNAAVEIQIDCFPSITTIVRQNGWWTVSNPFPMCNGRHCISITQFRSKQRYRDQLYFCICRPSSVAYVQPVAAPPQIPLNETTLPKAALPEIVPSNPAPFEDIAIITPPDGAVLSDNRPVISGRAAADSDVTICLAGHGHMNTKTDSAGAFRIQFPFALPNGVYFVSAIQNKAIRESCTAQSTFLVDTPMVLLPPSAAAPPDGAILQERRPLISGTAAPGNTVHICLRHCGLLDTVVEETGIYQLQFPQILPEGTFRYTVRQRDRTGRESAAAEHVFSITAILPIPPPNIETPISDAVLYNPAPFITGIGLPGCMVQVRLSGIDTQTAMVGTNGEYRIQFPPLLPDGAYTITALQADMFGNCSAAVTRTFQVLSTPLRITPLVAKTGSIFRTIDISFLLSGTPGIASIYYLMLPPGSSAPTAEEMLHYPNTAELITGVAVRGKFNVPVSPQCMQFTYRLTGRENIHFLPSETGAIDGYRYDIYLYAISASNTVSGITAFGTSAMAMPFDGGTGTMTDPFQIRALAPHHLQRYPDLLAGHTLNQSGASESARMLCNIERLQTLYDETNGLYGISNALAQHYLLTSSFDLSSYKTAYGGNGWRPIGNCTCSSLDNTVPVSHLEGAMPSPAEDKNDETTASAGLSGLHIFTGSLTGASNAICISNLTLTPHGTKPHSIIHTGLIGSAQNAAFRSIAFRIVRISPVPEPANGTLYAGILAAHASNCTFSEISVQDAQIVFPPVPNALLTLAAGGIAGILDGGALSDIKLSNLQITNASAFCSHCGGCIGCNYLGDSSDSQNRSISIERVKISGLRVRSHTPATLYAGSIAASLVAHEPLHLENIRIEDIDFKAPHLTGGGAIGYLYTAADTVITTTSVQDSCLAARAADGKTGGLIGQILCCARLYISAIQIDSAAVHAHNGAGGLAGQLTLLGDAECGIDTFTVSADASAILSHAGGLAGRIHRTDSALLFIRNGTVSQQSTITGQSHCGGLIGALLQSDNNHILCYIANCKSGASVHMPADAFAAGGFIGTGTCCALHSCTFDGRAEGGKAMGGILGSAHAVTLCGCICTGTVTGKDDVGGLVGNANAGTAFNAIDAPFTAFPNTICCCAIRHSHISAAAGGKNVGGLCGTAAGIMVYRCLSTADMDAATIQKTGLLIGALQKDANGICATIRDCYTTGNMTGTAIYAGGIAGYSEGEILRCCCAGNISGKNKIGGIAGCHKNTALPLSSCFVLGTSVLAQKTQAARIAERCGFLEQNFSLETLELLKNGIPATAFSNTDGADGFTLDASDLQSAMREAGFSPAIWDLAAVELLGHPLLLDLPE